MGCVVYYICIRNEWGCVMIVLDMVMYCIAGCAVGHWLGMLIVNRKKKAKEFRVTVDDEDLEVKLIARKIYKELNKDR